MSNFLAIAAVTESLRRMLDSEIGRDVVGARATAVKPAGSGSEGNGGLPSVGVNLYLYHISYNPNWRNVHLPGRRGDGSIIDRSLAALDLHYLLTFYGEEGKLEPQRVLGSVLRILHSKPIITHQMIKNMKKSLSDDITNVLRPLANSDLDEDAEMVRLTPISLSIEDLSKLWSVFFQIPYALSIAYQASVVLIEGREISSPALPVRESQLYILPFRKPVIEQVVSLNGDDISIVSDSTLTLRGKRLRGEVTVLIVGGHEIVLLENVRDDVILFNLSSLPALRAGVQWVQIAHQTLMGSPKTLHLGVESNIVPFVLHPVINKRLDESYDITVSSLITDPNSNAKFRDITIRLNPKVGLGQRSSLMLARLDVSKSVPNYSFTNPPLEFPPNQSEADTITFRITGVEAGRYLLQVQIDGAESGLEADLNPSHPPNYIQPSVEISWTPP